MNLTLYLSVDGTVKDICLDGTRQHFGTTPDGRWHSFYSEPLRLHSVVEVTYTRGFRGTFHGQPIVHLEGTTAERMPLVINDTVEGICRGLGGKLVEPPWVLFTDLPLVHHPLHREYTDFATVNEAVPGQVRNEGALSAEQFEKVRVATAAINDGTWSDLRDVAQVELSDEERERNKGEALAAAIKVVPLDVSSDKYNEYATKTIAKFIANQYSRADAEAEVMPYSEWCEIQERNHALIAKAAA
jgi:hypothetical protein